MFKTSATALCGTTGRNMIGNIIFFRPSISAAGGAVPVVPVLSGYSGCMTISRAVPNLNLWWLLRFGTALLISGPTKKPRIYTWVKQYTKKQVEIWDSSPCIPLHLLYQAISKWLCFVICSALIRGKSAGKPCVFCASCT